MKLVKWAVLLISLALTDGASTTEQPSDNLSFKNEFNNAMAAILRYYQPYWNGTFVASSEDSVKKFAKQSSNGILQNVTVKFLRWPPARAELPSHDNDSFTVSGQLKSLFVEGCLRDSHQHVVTEILALNYVVKSTIWNEVSVDFPDFDRNEIKLFAHNDQHKPNEETELKNEIATHVRTTFNEFITAENKDSWNVFKRNCLDIFGKFLFNTKEKYYFIDSIKSINYTLHNVTIRGLWNAKINTFNVSTLETFPEVEMSPVSGSAIRDSHLGSEELSFSAGEVHISVDQNIAKVNVNLKSKGYSVANAKGQISSPLPDGESKAIIGDIESGFAAALQEVWKNTKPRP